MYLTFCSNSYRFSRSTGYNNSAGGCVPYDYGEEEISVNVLIEEQRRPSSARQSLGRSPLLGAGGANSATSQVWARPQWM